MIVRLIRYARAYPLWFYAAVGLGWSYGLGAVYPASRQTGDAPCRSGQALAALTIAVTLLLFRAVDDVRDLAYDRAHNPGRPLVTGAVRVADLMALFFVGLAALLTLNAVHDTSAAGYGALCLYVCLILFADWRWSWPSPERMLLQLLVNVPLQTLIAAYVFLCSAYPRTPLPGARDVASAVAFVLCVTHIEFARRLVRDPAPGTRTYVHALGFRGTAVTTFACAFVAPALVLTATRPWSPDGHGAGWLALLALPVPVVAAVRLRRGAPRWPVGLAVLYVLLFFAACAAVGLSGPR